YESGRPAAKLLIKGQAMRLGLRPIFLFCDDPGAGVAGPTGDKAVVFVDSIPRIGEWVVLPDGTRWQVDMVLHHVEDYPQHDFLTTVTSVVARRLPGTASWSR